MPTAPRPPILVACAYCARPFWARHARRRYCTRSCNVRASYARNGRPAPRPRPVTLLPADSYATRPPVPAGAWLVDPHVLVLVGLLTEAAARQYAARARTPLEALAHRLGHWLADASGPRPR